MKKLLILIGGMLFVIAVLLIVTWWPQDDGSNIDPNSSDTVLPLDVNSFTTPITSPNNSLPPEVNEEGEHIPTLSVKGGGRMPVRNFLLDSQVEQLDDDFYEIATSEDGDGEYSSIYYYSDDGGIIVLLTREPLAVSRLLAENELREVLDLPDAQLCQLEILVQTNRYVNITYAGRNLGLSFCPGSVSFE